eukprot:6473195-Alexandrium_andersonii.AAC.1
MSASLVGSEMCIRDRRRPLQGSGAMPREKKAPAAKKTVSPRRSRSKGSCLLYTSDAADDM